MHHTQSNEYLVTEVLTAAPQKLHLMLIDAAVRQCERARQLWHERNDELAGEAIVKAQDIITELIAGLNYEEHSDLSRRVAAIYNFVFRSLVTAHLHRDAKSLAEAVRVLEIERDTWRQVCERTAGHVVPPPKLPVLFTSTQHHADSPISSLSFEA
jgi:flagellar protein FliS